MSKQSMQRSRDTQRTLNALYDEVVPRLATQFDELIGRAARELEALNRLALELGVTEVPTHTPDERGQLASVVWRPVARECTLGTLRTLARVSGPSREIPLSEVPDLVLANADVSTIAQDCGLSMDDSLIALRVTTSALMASRVLARVVLLRLDGEDVAFRVARAQLLVLGSALVRVIVDPNSVRIHRKDRRAEIGMSGTASVEPLGPDNKVIPHSGALVVRSQRARHMHTTLRFPGFKRSAFVDGIVKVDSPGRRLTLAVEGDDVLVERTPNGVLIKREITDNELRVFGSKSSVTVKRSKDSPLDVKLSATLANEEA